MGGRSNVKGQAQGPQGRKRIPSSNAVDNSRRMMRCIEIHDRNDDDEETDPEITLTIQRAKVMAKPVDLIDLAKRVVAEFQYHFLNIKYGRLYEIEYCKEALELGGNQLVGSQEEDCNCTEWKCVGYTIRNPEKPQDMEIATVKNFFDKIPKHLNVWGNQQKDELYWSIRLRPISKTSFFLCLAILELAQHLTQAGFTGWRLPDGTCIEFSDIWIVRLGFTIDDYPPMKVQSVAGSLSSDKVAVVAEHYDPPGKPASNSKATELSIHSGNLFVLAVNPDDSGQYMILDPTAKRFGDRTPYCDGLHGLVGFYKSTIEFESRFPGAVMKHDYNFNPAVIPFGFYDQFNYGSTLTKPPHLVQLVQSVWYNLAKPSCNYCGEIPRSGQNIRTVKVKKCGVCQKAWYCDEICQLRDWYSHQERCYLKKELNIGIRSTSTTGSSSSGPNLEGDKDKFTFPTPLPVSVPGGFRKLKKTFKEVADGVMKDKVKND